MDEKSSSLELKLYLLPSVDADQQQGQQQLPVKYKKGGNFTGPPTYVYGLTTRRNTYSREIKPGELCNHLGQAKYSYKKMGRQRCPNQAVSRQGIVVEISAVES